MIKQNEQLKNSRGWHYTLVIGLVAISEREEARSARVLRHFTRHALVSVSAPSPLIHEEKDLIKTSDIVQIKLSDIFKCPRPRDIFR